MGKVLAARQPVRGGAGARAVSFSAATVAVGFLALVLVDAACLRAIAFGGSCVVAISGLAAVTLLPPLMTWLGPALEWPRRVPASSPPPGSRGGWARWAQAVMSHPWSALAIAGVILVALAWPAWQLRSWNVGARNLPGASESSQG